MTNTPWGIANYIEPVCDGVVAFYTPSHGGFYVDPDHLHKIPSHWRAASFNGQGKKGWFEEDVDWAMVALSFPKGFSQYAEKDEMEITEIARKTMAAFHPDLI